MSDRTHLVQSSFIISIFQHKSLLSRENMYNPHFSNTSRFSFCWQCWELASESSGWASTVPAWTLLSKRSACLCFLPARIKDMSYHARHVFWDRVSWSSGWPQFALKKKMPRLQTRRSPLLKCWDYKCTTTQGTA